MTESVSIVMPAFNAAPFLRAAVESVLAQAGDLHELVVVDDGSSDDTAGIVESFRDPRVSLVRQGNLGVSAARNAGAARASHGLLLFLDADDVLLPGALDRLSRALVEDPDSVLAYGEVSRRYEGVSERDVYRETVFGPRPSGEVLPKLLRRNFIRVGAACIRRRAHESVRGFRPDLRHSEDWEYWTRIALRGPFAYLPPPPVLVHRIHGGSSARELARRPGEIAAAVAAVFSNPEVVERLDPVELHRCHRRQVAWTKAYLAQQHIGAGRWPEARRCLVTVLSKDPLRPREWLLLAAAVARCVPGPLRARLG